jgi:hypothetical protein
MTDLASVPLPLPQGAGLLDGELPLGLAALERAVRALTGSESTAPSHSTFLLRCVVVGSWLLGAVLAWAVVRRKSQVPEITLNHDGGLGRAVPIEEELP